MSVSFFPTLKRFIVRSHTESLAKKDLGKNFGDYRLDISFGQGSKAKVPWMSFLAPDVSTSNGYYPVFLYYKELNQLILAFGISEENSWLSTWPDTVVRGRQRVSEVLGLNAGFRYLDSWVFSSYDVDMRGDEISLSTSGRDVEPSDVDKDLNEILNLYQSCLPKPDEAVVVTKKTTAKKSSQKKILRPSPEIFDLPGRDGPTNTKSLASATADYRLLSIKDYQRSYQWTAAQIDELFTDLYEVIESGESHFFGTLIIQGEDDGQNGTVVDGQQRLTTVFILVSTLRDEVTRLGISEISSNDEDAMPINVLSDMNDFLFSTKRFSDQRFQSNRQIRPILRDSVIAPPQLSGQDRKSLPSESEVSTKSFLRALQTVRSEIADDLEFYGSDEDKLKRLFLLFRGLTEQFKVLRLETSDLSESLEIFLTLNNRGLPLGPSDIVRGEIMGVRGKNLSEKEADELQAKILAEWEAIAEVVEEPETFLRHYLVSTSDEKIQKKKIVAKVTEQFKSKSLHIKEQKVLAAQFWSKLQSSAQNYGSIVSPEIRDDTTYLLSLLEHLSKSHRIMVLGILDSDLEQQEKDELIRLTFIIAFRWVMANQNAQKLEDFYQERCKELRALKSPDFIQSVFKERIRQLPLNAKEFFSFEGDSSVITRVLLHAVHVRLHPKQEISPLENKRFHLEHIAPKTPTDHWKQKLVGMSASSRAYDQVVQQAGNLLLLDKKLNIEAQQKPFVQKRDEYYKSATFYSHTSDMSGLVEWTKDLISQRTKWLASMFEIIWAVDSPPSKVISFESWLNEQGKSE